MTSLNIPCVSASLPKGIFVAIALMLLSPYNHAVDWSAVKGIDMPLFYPGQTGMEWMLDKRSHDGAARYKKRGKPCRECHEGEEVKFGPRIASGQYWEEDAQSGRRGFANASIKVASEAGKLLVHVEWPHENSVAGNKLDKDFQTKITLMIGNEDTPEFLQGGCWVVCHQDARRMPKAKGDGVMKYLASSRNDIVKTVGGGEDYISAGQLGTMLGGGNFLEYWQARLNPGAEPEVISGYILKERTELESTTLTATAELNGKTWMLDFSRPMAVGTEGQKDIVAGKSYTIGLALHDQHTIGRFHLVSLEYTMGTSPGGDLQIKQL